MSNKQILWIQVLSLLYILFMIDYSTRYEDYAQLSQTFINIFINILTLPIIFVVIPAGLIYGIYSMVQSKTTDSIRVSIVVVSIISLASIIHMSLI